MGSVKGLPDKFELYEHQEEALEEIIEGFKTHKVVFLDAPTGSGKTVIGEATRLSLCFRGGLYVCSTKQLQDQFLSDFPYARVLKGRSNYKTELGKWPEVTCADCNGSAEVGKEDCHWCSDGSVCSYEIAKRDALRSDVAVINTSYYLAEANFVGGFSKRPFVVIDECHLLQGALLGFVEWSVSESMLRQAGLEAPKKGSHHSTIAGWIRDDLRPALQRLHRSCDPYTLRGIRQANAISGVLARCQEMAENVTKDTWIRDNKAGPMTLKPTDSAEHGQGFVWKHGDKFLCMSATIISASMMAKSLGLEDGEWTRVEMPMKFPKENRPVYLFPVADMSRKGKERGEWERLPEVLAPLLQLYSSSRVLIHTVSYELAKTLVTRLQSLLPSRVFISYSESKEKHAAIERYRNIPSAVMVASSLDTGYDFPNDLCDVTIVAKVPFPNMADAQVSAMMHGRDGNAWYTMETIRTIVQMTGRGVRSETDTCDIYIMDQQFTSNLWKRNKELFPKWWAEAIDGDFAVPEMLKALKEIEMPIPEEDFVDR